MSVHNILQEPMLEGDVYIGRAGKGFDGYFGNPFTTKSASRSTVLKDYHLYVYSRIKSDPEFRERVLGLYGKRLFCFCKPKPCHGDILEQVAKELYVQSTAKDK